MFKSTDATSPEEYIAALDEPRRSEIRRLDALIRDVAPGLEVHIASGMLAYGHYHYRSKSGREGEWFPIGLSSLKRYISVYVMAANDKDGYLAESYRDRLPKTDIGRSCVRFKTIDEIDLDVLRELLQVGATYDGADYRAQA